MLEILIPTSLGIKSGSSATAAYAVWATDASTTCPNVPANERVDCGFDGITPTDCGYRECCYGAESTPQCYFQQTSLPVTWSASTSGTTCFKVVNYLGTLVTNSLCPQNGALSVTATDGPLYLTS